MPSRLAGSQNAASSFSLANGNTNPTDIVTSGSHLWVVNDSITDKVFKYTAAASRISGSQSAAASFALATGNTNPQGIADPPAPDSNVSQRISRHTSRSRFRHHRVTAAALDTYLSSDFADQTERKADAITDQFLESLATTRHRRPKIGPAGHRTR